MSTPITTSKAAPSKPSALQNFSPSVLKYLQSISSGARHLPSTQMTELSHPPFQNKFLEYMKSACSSAAEPTSPIDLTYPISNYFINSSHNTYLEGNQLSSVSSTDAYKHVLLRGCRCVEIDVWNGEPKSKSDEAEISRSDEKKKHGFRAHITEKLSSHGPMKRLHKETSSSTSTASEGGGSLTMPSPWTSLSTTTRAEPRVLHGYTLTKEVPFRDVCIAIKAAAFVTSDLPIIVSLEVHAGPEQQEIMVEIMEKIWREHLIAKPGPETGSLPSPEALRNKILIKVKYVDPQKAVGKVRDYKAPKQKSDISSTSSSSASETDVAPTEVKKKKKASIIPSLSALGVYTRAYHFKSLSAPEANLPFHVFSLNEKKFMEVHSSSGPTIFGHNRNHLMRAFPSGMRVRSDNLDPAPFWRKGVQMVALNWQRWDEGMMLNEAMFTGSKGYVLKPEGYRSKGDRTHVSAPSSQSQADSSTHKTLSLSIEILAAQDIPLPLDDSKLEGFHPYVKCELHVEKPSERTGAPIEGGGKSKDGEFKWKSRTMKGTDVDFGGERVEFHDIAGVDEGLSFLRFKIQDDKIGKDDLAAWACFRLDRLRSGLRFVHLLDAAGMESKGALLVAIEKSLD
ncbi:hypothetical protein ACLMJK_002594 [Lecanora helva]